VRSLTKKQERVIGSTETLLVIGRPGTGKTTCGLLKALDRVQAGLAPHQRVLFLSFSNAAVQRIQATIRGSVRLEDARHLEVTTFHALAYRILRSHGRLAGVRGAVSVHLPEQIRTLEATFEGDSAAELRRLEKDGRLPFGRFVPLLVRLFERHPSILDAYAARYPLIIVDEFQDTSDEEVEMLASLADVSQVVCLGDPEQRIFEFREGVAADRLERFQQDHHPVVVTLKRNHRSGGCDLTTYAKAVLAGAPVSGVDSVTVLRYQKADQQADYIKKAIFIAERKARGKKKRHPVSVAVMGISNRFVGRISEQIGNPSDMFDASLRHRVLVLSDELAAGWAVAFKALEHGPGRDINSSTADVLELVAQFNFGVQRSPNHDRGRKLTEWADALRRGTLSRRAKGVYQLRDGLSSLGASWTGDPQKDVLRVRRLLQDSGAHFKRIVGVLNLRMPVGPGEPATGPLAELFASIGSYEGASAIGDEVLLRERLLDGTRSSGGRTLMTLHKCKGKEFDAVVVVDGMYNDTMILREEHDASAQPRSRRLLHVALTRARKHAVIVTPRWPPNPILPAGL
jgi:DNA helicase-2/ATP-dependent DNA helicase PcrA